MTIHFFGGKVGGRGGTTIHLCFSFLFVFVGEGGTQPQTKTQTQRNKMQAPKKTICEMAATLREAIGKRDDQKKEIAAAEEQKERKKATAAAEEKLRKKAIAAEEQKKRKKEILDESPSPAKLPPKKKGVLKRPAAAADLTPSSKPEAIRKDIKFPSCFSWLSLRCWSFCRLH